MIRERTPEELDEIYDGMKEDAAMSMPSTSDDGDPATHWDQTTIKQEFSDLYRRFAKWRRDNEKDFPSNDFEALVRIADTVFGEIEDTMTGKL